MKTHILTTVTTGLFALAAVSGCGSGQSTSTTPMFEVSKADTLPLNADEMNAVTGLKLNYQDKVAPGYIEPPDPYVADQGDQQCVGLLGFDTSTIGTIYTAYRQNTSQEGKEDYTHNITQEVVLVADPGTAKKMLSDALAKPASACDGKTIHIKDGKVRRSFHKTAVSDTDVSVMISSLNLDPPNQPTGWGCAVDAHAKSNVVIYAMACQSGNGAPTAKAIVDKVSTKVPG
ncbi:sensor domain-containing protein [Nocardia sp. NPDC101769]|uniref:sensor domain-containing protein n=1 Tax=Nocardia sp. NPDC101769 TaxID=3364333 RepID=UPI00380DD933